MQFFEVKQSAGIYQLLFSREKVLNALNKALIEEGISLLNELKTKKDLRILILSGAGEKAFVAGADISELNNINAEEAREVSLLGHKFLKLIEDFDKPVIAAINGFALGGGLEIALACDLRYASDNAKLGLPEVSLGLIPGYGGTQRLSRLIGQGKAKEYIFTGEMVSAKKALDDGLIQGLFSKEELMESVIKIAEKITKQAPLAISAAKRAINLGSSLDLNSAIAVEVLEFAQICATGDKKEGTDAFLAKRKPEFKGI